MDHTEYECDGSRFTGTGGSYIGHVFPGMVFVIWSTHWMLSIFKSYFARGPENYRSRCWHKLFFLEKDIPLEPVVKVVFPLLAMVLELYLAHKGGWRTLICPAGSVRAGHIFSNHIGNWQHAAMYPGFIVSGLVDIVALKFELPDGVQQAYLGLAFFAESFLMGLHVKHEPLDKMVHLLLFGAMLCNCLFVVLEIFFPHNFLVSCGRCAATYLQGSWFIVVADMMFTGRIMWDVSEGDMAPAMFAPVQFVITNICIICYMILVFIVFLVYYGNTKPPEKPLAYEGSTPLLERNDKLKHGVVKIAD